MQFIDTHCHLSDGKYEGILGEILTNAKDQDVTKIITIGCSLGEIETSLQIAKANPEYVFSTAGLYPHDNETPEFKNLDLSQRLQCLEHLISTEKTIKAVGECGLDNKEPPPYETPRPLIEQKDLFIAQLELAKKYDLPIIIHSRLAAEDTLEILKNYASSVKFVWHCFSEDLETSKKALDLGGFLSFTGLITYKKFAFLKDVIKQAPLDQIMLETDGPYLIPEKLRDKGTKSSALNLKVAGDCSRESSDSTPKPVISHSRISEPWHVRIIAQEIATIKEISLETVANSTTKNATNFFRI